MRGARAIRGLGRVAGRASRLAAAGACLGAVTGLLIVIGPVMRLAWGVAPPGPAVSLASLGAFVVVGAVAGAAVLPPLAGARWLLERWAERRARSGGRGHADEAVHGLADSVRLPRE